LNLADTQPANPPSLSRRLAQILEDDTFERLTFTDLAARLHARAWGALLFVFAAINVLPLPPGTSPIFALPMLIVSAQMAFGRETPWFPARLDRRGITKRELKRLVDKVGWLELRGERIFKPRLARLTGPRATRAIGLVCFLLSLLAAIPVPLFHYAPAAAVVLFGLALIYRDGAFVIVAAVAGVLSVGVVALLIHSGLTALSYAMSWWGL
jgi:hypothetical protein